MPIRVCDPNTMLMRGLDRLRCFAAITCQPLASKVVDKPNWHFCIRQTVLLSFSFHSASNRVGRSHAVRECSCINVCDGKETGNQFEHSVFTSAPSLLLLCSENPKSIVNLDIFELRSWLSEWVRRMGDDMHMHLTSPPTKQQSECMRHAACTFNAQVKCDPIRACGVECGLCAPVAQSLNNDI